MAYKNIVNLAVIYKEVNMNELKYDISAPLVGKKRIANCVNDQTAGVSKHVPVPASVLQSLALTHLPGNF